MDFVGFGVEGDENIRCLHSFVATILHLFFFFKDLFI